ncbi:MAG: glycogen/starch/alpha-glucan phosphorylase [Pelosinus sp.]|nr:glycogen/starch/alpha-glucan phosphorylase [Pelosinus sp.]
MHTIEGISNEAAGENSYITVKTKWHEGDIEAFKTAYVTKLQELYGESLANTSNLDKYQALVILLKEQIAEGWIQSKEQQRTSGSKQVYYFSIEFLLGRLLGSMLYNLGLTEVCKKALNELGIELGVLEQAEEDPGLGNGGLGRLAACYLDSMAANGLFGYGCGLRYRYGLFEQKIMRGYQHEYPDNWLIDGFPWEVRRPDESVEVRFGGTVEKKVNGKVCFVHENYQSVLAVPYDVPVVGHNNNVVNTLRLWSAEAQLEELAVCEPSRKDCHKAIWYSQEVADITNILYPDDSTYAGKRLRLKQQYFLVSAGVKSIIRSFKKNNGHFRELADKVAIHINDTHPALAIPEIMRILMDEEGVEWTEAWKITTRTISYTNHTVLPEALEKWPVELMQSLLPRIYIIIQEINEYFCHELWQQYPGEWDKISSMAIIANGQVFMAHLAIAGSHSVNGVAKLHTEILKTKVMKNFYEFQPDKFSNVTNGVTHRRWLAQANPLLTELLNDTIGTGWLQYPCDLAHLLKHADDTGFQHYLLRVKLQNKVALAKYIKDKYNISVDVRSIFDVHIKRIHAYKRQLLNALHIMSLYNRLKENPGLDITPRTFIFGGKTAMGYFAAKKMIKLIHEIAAVVNNDPAILDKIKVVFLENYNVSLAELIIPASDVSEQIPTAGYEASGTGNMKLMMNGAVTIGTLDGANIEIKNAVGDENIITFGLTADEVMAYYQDGGYNPWDIYQSDEAVRMVLDQLVNGFFPVSRDEFAVLYESLLNQGDHFFVLKDFAAYCGAQSRVDEKYKNQAEWLKMCCYNIGNAGKFAGDRTFSEYAVDIWEMVPHNEAHCYCKTDDAFAASVAGCHQKLNQLWQ